MTNKISNSDSIITAESEYVAEIEPVILAMVDNELKPFPMTHSFSFFPVLAVSRKTGKST